MSNVSIPIHLTSAMWITDPWGSGYRSSCSRAWIPSEQSQSPGWCHRPHLGVINRAWFKREREREEWMNVSAPGSLVQDYCAGERSDTSHYETQDVIRFRRWAVIKCRNPFSFANFAFDDPGISIGGGGSRTAGEGRVVFFPGAGWVQTRKRSDLSILHFEPHGRSRVNLLTSRPRVYLLIQRRWVKINGRHQHQDPEGKQKQFTSTCVCTCACVCMCVRVCVCVDVSSHTHTVYTHFISQD